MFQMDEFELEQAQRDIAVFVGEVYSQEQEHSRQVKLQQLLQQGRKGSPEPALKTTQRWW